MRCGYVIRNQLPSYANIQNDSCLTSVALVLHTLTEAEEDMIYVLHTLTVHTYRTYTSVQQATKKTDHHCF
jgi:hypothetical protein